MFCIAGVADRHGGAARQLADKPLGLTLTEFWIVHALVKNPGHVKNRQQLMDAANVVLDDNTITSHISAFVANFRASMPRSTASKLCTAWGIDGVRIKDL